MLESINATVAVELERIPRGPRGSAQNLFRAAYQMTRVHSLSAHTTDRWTADESLAIAVDIIRASVPEFEPTVRSDGPPPATAAPVSGPA